MPGTIFGPHPKITKMDIARFAFKLFNCLLDGQKNTQAQYAAVRRIQNTISYEAICLSSNTQSKLLAELRVHVSLDSGSKAFRAELHHVKCAQIRTRNNSIDPLGMVSV